MEVRIELKQRKKRAAHLPKGCVELDCVDLLIGPGGPQRAPHSQHAAALVPLDAHHVHQRVDVHRVWGSTAETAP